MGVRKVRDLTDTIHLDSIRASHDGESGWSTQGGGFHVFRSGVLAIGSLLLVGIVFPWGFVRLASGNRGVQLAAVIVAVTSNVLTVWVVLRLP